MFIGPFDHFRLGSEYEAKIILNYSKSKYDLKVIIQENDKIVAKLPDGSEHSVMIIKHENNRLMTLIEKEMSAVDYFIDKDTMSIWTNDIGRFDFKFEIDNWHDLKNNEKQKDASGRIVSAMPCKLNQIFVRVGDTVQVGSQLCVTEAMKMEVKQ